VTHNPEPSFEPALPPGAVEGHFRVEGLRDQLALTRRRFPDETRSRNRCGAQATVSARSSEHGQDAGRRQPSGGWSHAAHSGSTKPEGVSVVPMGGGIHFKTGPAGIYYRAADAKTGAYEVRAAFSQMEPSAHPEAYGLFIGGANLAAATQKYTYFLVRQDGKFMISRRDGAKVTPVVPWDNRGERPRRPGCCRSSAADKVRFS
jgi:hypothetical protein